MASLMLVNPRKRRKAKAKATPKRRVTRRRAKRTTAKRRRVYARNPIAVNPKRSAKRTHRRKYRRNPIGGTRGMKGIMKPIMPAAISAVGAIGLDLGWGILASKLPAALSAGPVRHVTKAVGALALGALAGMVVKKDTANLLATGALTVVFHSAMRETLQKVAPTIQLGEYMDDGMNGLAEYFPEGESMDGLGEYMMDGIGYTGAGVNFDPYDNESMGGMGEGEYAPFTL